MKNDELFAKYPLVFKKIKYIECGNGWFRMLDKLCSLIEHEIKRVPKELNGKLYAAQVKEKFGGLRFYMEESTPFIDGAISLAEDMSFTICEVCGNVGKPRNFSWVRTLCDHHEEEEKSRAK